MDDSLARSALLTRLGDEISALVDGDFAVVAGAGGGGADFDGTAGEFVSGACVDAGFGGWEVLGEVVGCSGGGREVVT